MKKKEHKLAIALLGETTRSGYERMRNSLDGITSIPTYHTLTKKRPTIHPIVVPLLKPFDSNDDDNDAVVDPFLDFDPLRNSQGPEEYQLEVALRTISNASDSNDGARLDGSYSDWIEMMEKKHSDKGREIPECENVVVVDCIDGAEHLKSKKKITSLI